MEPKEIRVVPNCLLFWLRLHWNWGPIRLSDNLYFSACFLVRIVFFSHNKSARIVFRFFYWSDRGLKLFVLEKKLGKTNCWQHCFVYITSSYHASSTTTVTMECTRTRGQEGSSLVVRLCLVVSFIRYDDFIFCLVERIKMFLFYVWLEDKIRWVEWSFSVSLPSVNHPPTCQPLT